MEIKTLQKSVDNWIKEYGVRYFNEMTNLALLMEETGELARLLARKYGEQSFKNPVSGDELNKKIADEIGDIIFVLTCLANQMDIDLETTIEENLKKKTSRDNIRHKNNPKLL
ncbi:MAG TPA: pyrophosphatase [Bacteroidetes bacterium]|nr:pyrophosphatase [Bacteroidota bacterium]